VKISYENNKLKDIWLKDNGHLDEGGGPERWSAQTGPVKEVERSAEKASTRPKAAPIQGKLWGGCCMLPGEVPQQI